MKKITAVLRYLISVHLLGILFFTIFRIVLYFYNERAVVDIENEGLFFTKALIKGLQFDNFIVSYIAILPLLCLSIFALCNKIPRNAVIAVNTFFIVIYFFAFAITVANIAYFSYFFAHLGVSAFEWFQFGGTTLGLIFQSGHYFFIVLLTVSVAVFVFAVIRLGKQLLKTQYADLKKVDYCYYLPLTVLIYGLCFLGMRGSFQNYPLQMGYAYFSNSSFFNQMGINPNFSLIKSFDSLTEYNNVNDLMPLDSAFLLVRKELNVPLHQDAFCINREVHSEGEIRKPNIVIIFLESMAAKYLEYEHNGSSLTPFLHELISKSYYFENFYSSGVHTNNGIVSTLYGFPTLFDKPSMKNEAHYTGLPVNLRNQGYQNLFFVTNNPNYDHMNLFLLESGFDRIYSQYDYPLEKAVNKYGVQDDFLLEYALERLNETSRNKKPFMAALLTISNHIPFVIPQKYEDSGDTNDKKMTRFVDDVLRNFMENASKEKWFKNTIFVLLGDHGNILEPKYDMPIERNRPLLIMYSPLFEDAPKRFDFFCGQVDLFPTLLGMLNMPYTNNSFGIDVFKEQRSYMCFADDNRLGCIDKDYFYVRNIPADTDLLYDLHDTTGENNIMQKEPSIGELMKSYSVSMIVVADYLIKNDKTGK